VALDYRMLLIFTDMQKLQAKEKDIMFEEIKCMTRRKLTKKEAEG